MWFSTFGTVRARRFLAERPDAVSICHNDVMAGDIYVDHGVILASMRARGNPAWLMIRNPFHIFIHLRDLIRYRGRTHRVVVALAQADVTELRESYGRVRPRVVIIPNGVDLDRFRPPTPEERREAREALQLGEEERVAVFVGHEFHRKGLSFAIDALRFAPGVLLLIVGGSDDIIAEANAEAQELGVGDRVLFLGPRHDLAAFLAASDMFVLPSAYEANALVVLEALASGLPVVTTRVGFAPEIIVDGQNGFLVDRDARDIGARLTQLAEEDDLSAWSRRARASVEAYSWRARRAALPRARRRARRRASWARAGARAIRALPARRAHRPPGPADDAHRADRADDQPGQRRRRRRLQPRARVRGSGGDGRAVHDRRGRPTSRPPRGAGRRSGRTSRAPGT